MDRFEVIEEALFTSYLQRLAVQGDPGEENWAGLGAEILTLGCQDVIGGVVFSEDPSQALAELSKN